MSTRKKSKKIYKVDVIFRNAANWSHEYTYYATEVYAAGAAVVVPAGSFYSIAMVVTCKEYKEEDVITEGYKCILGVVPVAMLKRGTTL